ncbi:MAG TPA: hypothetical protein VGC85_09625 [Chthoniobacterales bacterium]
MRLIASSLSLAVVFLTSCAYQGVIVQKQARPHPLYESIGIDGVYSFLLRDNSGAMRRQMVTPEVFQAYAEGQYFNDQQAAATSGEFKATQPAVASAKHLPTQRASHLPPEPAPLATPRRVSAAPPPPIETSQSFRASEMQQSSRSMTATLRTEVHSDTPPESDGMKSAPAAVTANAERESAASSTKEKPAAKSHKVAQSKHAKAKPAAAKARKPWRMTEPTVETNATPQPPSEGPADDNVAPAGSESAPAEKSAPVREQSDVVYIPPPTK